MGVQNEQALSQAFELIEADKLEEARAILKPILDADKDNPDVWWLYAHAVNDPETARLALSNVRRLDPDYLNAGELLYSLEKHSPASDLADALSEKEPSFLPAFPSTLPGLSDSNGDADDDDWDLPDDEEEEADAPFFRRPIFLLAIGTVIFAIIASLFVLQSLPQTQNPAVGETPTNQAVVMETSTVEATAIEAQLTTPEQVSSNDEFDNIYAALSDFSVADNGIGFKQTALGNTVVASVCTEPGAVMRETLPNVLKALARESSTLSAETQAISAQMVDCSNNATLLMIGVPIADAQAYASGSLDDNMFQAKWQPVN